MNRYLAMTIPLLVLSGCVSVGKYDDLKKLYDEAQTQLGDRQMRIGSLAASVSVAEGESKQLKAENQRARAQLVALDAERNRLMAEQHELTLKMTQLLEDSSALKQSTEQLRVAFADLSRRKTEADRRVAEFKNLLTRFKSLIDAGTLKVTISDGRMVLQLPTDVLFDSGSAKLSKQGLQAITEVTNILKEVSGRRYQVEGHTDNVPIHNPQYRSNWELAAARGLGVVRAMSDAGVDPQLVSAASYGEYHPTASNDDPAGRKENRRIEIIVVPNLSMLPGYEELQQVVQAS